MTPVDRQDLVERDLQMHSKTITELTIRMGEYEKQQAVKEVKDEFLEERLTRIEKIGIWILLAFGGSFITIVANFVFKGGLFLGK